MIDKYFLCETKLLVALQKKNKHFVDIPPYYVQFKNIFNFNDNFQQCFIFNKTSDILITDTWF